MEIEYSRFEVKMKAEYVLEPKQKIVIKEKQILRSMLSQEQIVEFECGKLVAMCGGQKLRLDDEVKGTVLMLTPLQGG